MKFPKKDVYNAILALLGADFKEVTFFSPNRKSRVRARRVIWKRGREPKGYATVVLSLGRPNYREREFIKKNKKLSIRAK